MTVMVNRIVALNDGTARGGLRLSVAPEKGKGIVLLCQDSFPIPPCAGRPDKV